MHPRTLANSRKRFQNKHTNSVKFFSEFVILNDVRYDTDIFFYLMLLSKYKKYNIWNKNHISHVNCEQIQICCNLKIPVRKEIQNCDLKYIAFVTFIKILFILQRLNVSFVKKKNTLIHHVNFTFIFIIYLSHNICLRDEQKKRSSRTFIALMK